MPEINLDLSYFEWPEVVRLTGLLGRGAEVLPIRLKTYCGRVHPKDGRLSGYSAREVESAIGWWGTPEQATAALVKVGFLAALDGGGYEVREREGVSWQDGQGHIAAYAERASKAARARHERIRGSSATSNAASIAKDENKHNPNERTSGKAPPDGGATARPREPEGGEAWKPQNDRQKAALAAARACQKIDLGDPSIIAAWDRAYPDVDLARQIAKCEAWAVAKNVTRSAKGWRLTMTNQFLGKEQDRARPGAAHAGAAASGRGGDYDRSIER